MSVVQSVLRDGHAPEGERSRPDHREPSLVLRGPGAEAGRLWQYFAGVFGSGVRRSARDGGRGERLFWAADFEFQVRGAGAGYGSGLAAVASGHPVVAAEDPARP